MRSVMSSVSFTLAAIIPATSMAWEGRAQDVDHMAADVKGGPAHPENLHGAPRSSQHTPRREGLLRVPAVGAGD